MFKSAVLGNKNFYKYSIYNNGKIQKSGTCTLLNSIFNRVLRCNLLTIRDNETGVVTTGSEYEIELS